MSRRSVWSRVLVSIGAGRLVAGGLALLPAAPGVSPAAVVAEFYNSAYVDTTSPNPINREASNLKAGYEALGHTVNTFTGVTATAFNDVLSGADVLAIPALEGGSLAPVLSAAAKQAISNFVASGGSLIVHGCDGAREATLVNAVFGFYLSTTARGDGTNSTSTSEAAGTLFAGGQASLPGYGGIFPWRKATLPAGARSVYQFNNGSQDCTTVALIRVGKGKIIFFAWNWWNAAPVGASDGGWLRLLELAVDEARPHRPAVISVFTDPAYVDWDQEVTNLVVALRDMGHTVVPFRGKTADDFTRATEAADILVIPELEAGALSTALDPFARDAIGDFVCGGGGLIVHGDDFGRHAALLNDVFGYTVAAGPHTVSLASTRSADAAGTAFEGGPGAIGGNSLVTPLVKASLPAGALSVYEYTSGVAQTAVALIPRCSGEIVFLGWDWYGAAPFVSAGADAGWHRVLSEAVDACPRRKARVVAMFYNKSFVDSSSPTLNNEPPTLKAALTGLGHRVNTFTGITERAFSLALTGADALSIPELEVGNLAAALSPGAKAAISNYVGRGGWLLLNGEGSGRDAAFANQVLGFAVVGVLRHVLTGPQLTEQSAGTPFLNGPSSLAANNGHYPWRKDSLPFGAKSIYEFNSEGTNYTSVALLPRGDGNVAFLAWDWWNAKPLWSQDGGWVEVLERAVAGVPRRDYDRFDSFDPAPSEGLWSAVSGGAATNGSRGFFQGNALWFNDWGSRLATTTNLNTSAGGEIVFQFRAGDETSDVATYWERCEEGEDVVLEYSTDGTTFTRMALYDAPAISDWQQQVATIPPAARTDATWFRWRQLTHSGLGYDNWALDNVCFNLHGAQQFLGRFEWQTIPSRQFVSNAFDVAVTARDTRGGTMWNYAGAAALRGETPRFADDFEDGSFSDWQNMGGSYTRAISGTAAAEGSTRSLTLTGGSSGHFKGVKHDLDRIRPDRAEFSVRSASASAADGYFVLGTNDNTEVGTVAFFYMRPDGQMGLHENNRWHGTPYSSNRWYRIRLDLDWSAKTVAFYADGVLVTNNIPFRNAGVSCLTRLDLYNFNSSQAWWDEIRLTEGVPTAPSATTAFAGGAWSGQATVLAEAANMCLRADACGQEGRSRAFAVGIDDAYEENDSMAAAYELASARDTWLSSLNGFGRECDGADFYRIRAYAGSEWLAVDCTFEHAAGDINLYLFDAVGNPVGDSSGHSDWELMEYLAPGPGTYYVLVTTSGGPRRSVYDLRWRALPRDSDGDGMPSDWERAHNLDPYDDGSGDPDNGADGDPDHDGMRNLDEWKAGCNPWNSNSVFRISGLEPQPQPAGMMLTVKTEQDQRYTIQYTDGNLPDAPLWRAFFNTNDGVGTFFETRPSPAQHTFTDDFTYNTSGGTPPAGQRTYRVSTGPALKPGRVALFDAPAFVSQGGGFMDESGNIEGMLAGRGYSVRPITGVAAGDFRAGVAEAEAMIVPDQEMANLGAALDAGACAAISNFVVNGGTLIVHGNYQRRDAAFVNRVFGWAVVGGGYSAWPAAAKTGAAAGTPFAGGPATLPTNNGVYPWITNSLPAGAKVIYGFTLGNAYATVATIARGNGLVVFLAWDWYNAAPVGTQDGGWNDALEAALDVCRYRRVGYYDTVAGQGVTSQTPPVAASGGRAINITSLSATELEGLPVLFAQNRMQGYRPEFLNHLADIENAVRNGMVLILHDRDVAASASVLPGGSGIAFTSTAIGNINVINPLTLVADGPGGTVGDTTLDTPSSSANGYAAASSLPPGAMPILRGPSPSHVVTFGYPFGKGWVVYSSIPLDYYLSEPGIRPKFNLVYGPNVVSYGMWLP